MSSGMVIAIAIPVLVVLAAVVGFTSLRRRDAQGLGHLSRETRKRDSQTMSAPPVSDEARELERSVALARVSAEVAVPEPTMPEVWGSWGHPTPVPKSRVDNTYDYGIVDIRCRQHRISLATPHKRVWLQGEDRDYLLSKRRHRVFIPGCQLLLFLGSSDIPPALPDGLCNTTSRRSRLLGNGVARHQDGVRSAVAKMPPSRLQSSIMFDIAVV